MASPVSAAKSEILSLGNLLSLQHSTPPRGGIPEVMLINSHLMEILPVSIRYETLTGQLKKRNPAQISGRDLLHTRHLRRDDWQFLHEMTDELEGRNFCMLLRFERISIFCHIIQVVQGVVVTGPCVLYYRHPVPGFNYTQLGGVLWAKKEQLPQVKPTWSRVWKLNAIWPNEYWNGRADGLEILFKEKSCWITTFAPLQPSILELLDIPTWLKH